ncbi:MAG: LysM peptidoglycan-binding domain-containing protein [Bacteroidetes bacterium]|nr:LysM peptidoglycan-binding domain-containing protein [Rhodothermia bacterium]MCS7155748.1 LysM peptidoglycan-binding domain-containing protein [Bacteroidota bacterium]MCX7906151.1 LysM peptidoglycan-binding domain-containing protein [Bacteroidota bacterium]MDW8138279.1 LysM peptidoglycan-binding domain-containing protein [Bacteroidota bacterium]MDW8285963.1 LysM peptidoglycan-binding domain-containing protein [Bacteroidota bacterium]
MKVAQALLALAILAAGTEGSVRLWAQARTEDPYHVVQPGETLYRISQRYGVSVQDLRRWNNLPSNRIRVGQRLRVRAPEAISAGVTETPLEDRDFVVHVVQRGETLYRIAQRYGVSVAELRRWNGLGDNSIRAGQRLRVRLAQHASTGIASEAEGRFHVVQRGETLFEIARRYGLAPQRLQEANSLASPTVYPGQRLRIPPSLDAPSAPVRSWQTYVVQPGDKAAEIAQRFGMSLEALREANGLRSDSLRAGDILVVYRPEATQMTETRPVSPSLRASAETLAVQPTTPLPNADWGHVYQSGTATVYGVEISGPTASGELYDPLKFTCAHPSLPFGTVIMVTNRWNQRSVFVKVNDRPPKGTPPDVLLVLSPAAAREIQLAEGQRAAVEIRIVR